LDSNLEATNRDDGSGSVNTTDSSIHVAPHQVLVAFSDRRPVRRMRVWLAWVVGSMVVVYGLVVPATADWAVMQAFADQVSRIIPQFEAAVAVTDFEAQARVMLALDRVLIPVWVLLGAVVNFGASIPPKHHPVARLLAGSVLVAMGVYFVLFPHVPDPPDPRFIERRNLYPLMTSNLAGFALVHGLATMLASAMFMIYLLALVRIRLLAVAYREWRTRT